MAARKLKITYLDERVEIVKVLPRAYTMTEAYLDGFADKNLYLATFYLAWASLNTLRKTTLDYETWVDQIEVVEDYEEPEKPDVPIEEVPPTPPVQSGDGLSE